MNFIILSTFCAYHTNFLIFLSFQVGDQVCEINGCHTAGMTHSQAIDLIQNGGSKLKLVIKRTGKPPPNIGEYFACDKYWISVLSCPAARCGTELKIFGYREALIN